MKSLADLHALRDKLKADIKLRQSSGTKIIVGMGYLLFQPVKGSFLMDVGYF